MTRPSQEILDSLTDIPKLVSLGVRDYHYELGMKHGWFFIEEKLSEGGTVARLIHMNESGLLGNLEGPTVYYHDKAFPPRYFLNGNNMTEEDYWNNPLVVKHKLNKILNDNV